MSSTSHSLVPKSAAAELDSVSVALSVVDTVFGHPRLLVGSPSDHSGYAQRLAPPDPSGSGSELIRRHTTHLLPAGQVMSRLSVNAAPSAAGMKAQHSSTITPPAADRRVTPLIVLSWVEMVMIALTAPPGLKG